MQPPVTVGRYQIAAELGRGGMAAVYRAFDPLVRREVALKLLPRESLHNSAFRRRFEQEAHTIAALEHPAIVPVYDFGEEDGQPFIVMRLMTGGSLADRIQTGKLPLTEVARIVSALAPGLDRAHALGIIHRDLKPANILFDGFNNPYLSDFGLVKLVGSDPGITADSGTFGTPDYMAPEMTRKRRITKLVDIYALGISIFEMLAGKPPYQGDDPIGVLMAHTTDPIPDLRGYVPGLPSDIQEVIERALAKDPARRYQSAGDLAADLDALILTGKPEKPAVLHQGIPPQLDGAEVRQTPVRRALPRPLIGAGAGIVIFAAVAMAFLMRSASAPAPVVPGTPASMPAVAAPAQSAVPSGGSTPAGMTPIPVPTITLSPNAITRDNVRQVQPVHRLTGHSALVNAVAWSPDGTLASAGADKTIILWNAQTGEPLATLSGHTNWVQALAFSPDGSRLVSASSDHSAIIWDMSTHEAVQTIHTPSYGLNGVDWSPDGLRLALSPFYTNPLLWSVQTGQLIRELKGHTEQVDAVAFSNDGAYLASGAKDARVMIWDAVTGDAVRELDGHTRGVLAVAWSPFTHELATGSEDQRVIIWDAETGEIELKLEGHTDQVNSVTWSADGNMIASGSSDGTVKIWDADSGDVLRTLDGSAGPVLGVAWSADGAWIASAQNDGTVILWGLAP